MPDATILRTLGFGRRFALRSPLWNQPISEPDDRWELFNHLLGQWLAEQPQPFTESRRCRFLEIGVWQGSTVHRVFQRFGNIFDYVGVDPYGELVDDPYKGLFWQSSDEANRVYATAHDEFTKAGGALLRQSSDDFFRESNAPFDVVFIDGDHRHAGALRDCINGFERLPSGGMLIVDDVGNNFHPEVEWAVREFAATHKHRIAASGIHPLFFQLPGMTVPVMLQFACFKRK